MLRCHRILLPALALCLALAPTPSAARTTGVVTAGFLLETLGSQFASFGGTSFIKARGQTFTAEVSGQLVSVALRLGLDSPSESTVRIGVHAVDGNGLPVQPPLAVEDFSADLIPIEPDFGFVDFDLSADTAQLAAGVEYAITVVIDPIDPAPAPFVLNGSATDGGYDGGMELRTFDGTTWERTDTGDVHFEVRVDDTVSAQAQSIGATKARFRR